MENNHNYVDLDECFLFDAPNKSWDFSFPDITEEESTSSNSSSQSQGHTKTENTGPKPRISKNRTLSRKPKQPDWFGKKTEDYDKYWIRKFRAYLKRNADLVMSL